MDILEGILYMFWRGIAIGVIISAPMGPVGILCVQRTLEKGRSTGFFTGVGAAISDLFYCLLTGFGLSFIEEFLKANQNVIQIIGSVVLVVFGVYLFRSNPSRTLKKPDAMRTSRRRDILQGFLFTFSNPLIIFLIIGLFARFNFLLPEISLVQYGVGFVSIFAGALMWWWVVSYFVNKVRSHFNLRSMWLINKVTGVIIMIFAIVGVVTAVTGIASADTREPVYLNSTRGFGILGDAGGGGKPLVLHNESKDTMIRFLPLDRVEEFSFSLRVSNQSNDPGKTYRHSTEKGQTSVSHPSWGVVVAGGGSLLEFEISTLHEQYDDIMPTRMRLTARLDGRNVAEALVSDGVEFFTGENAWRLARRGGEYILSGGNRLYDIRLRVSLPDLSPDSVGLFVAPGGQVSADHMSLRTLSDRMPATRADVSHFADPDVRRSYFSRSEDPIEGEWEIFDRSLDDDRLRIGGDYRIAVVARRDGYDIIYLKGAQKNASTWGAGMGKGTLRVTSFRNVFDVEWLDPAHSPIPGEIKGQFTAPDMLVLQFVDHGSTLRLRKTKAYGKQ